MFLQLLIYIVGDLGTGEHVVAQTDHIDIPKNLIISSSARWHLAIATTSIWKPGLNNKIRDCYAIP